MKTPDSNTKISQTNEECWLYLYLKIFKGSQRPMKACLKHVRHTIIGLLDVLKEPMQLWEHYINFKSNISQKRGDQV